MMLLRFLFASSITLHFVHSVALTPWTTEQAESPDSNVHIFDASDNSTTNISAIDIDDTANLTTFGENVTVPVKSTSATKIDITCWPKSPALVPALLPDCVRAIDDIIAYNDDYRKVIIWSNNPAVKGRPVKDMWPKRTCQVEIAPEYGLDMVDDAFSMGDVNDVAHAIFESCMVGKKNLLGGTALVGPKQELRVLLRGRPSGVNDENVRNETVPKVQTY